MKSISLAMITRNEEEFIKMSISSVGDWVDEIIIVDTGSKDDTISISRSLGASVYSTEWTNFSAARNYSLEKCKGDWIFVLDADEQLSPESGPLLRELTAGNPDIVYRITQLNLSLFHDSVSVPVVRLFPNRPSMRFSGFVHERLEIRPGEVQVANSKIIVNHWQMPSDIDPHGKKQVFYEDLLKKSLINNPNDPETLLRISLLERNRGNYQISLSFAEKAEKHSNPGSSYCVFIGMIKSECLLSIGYPQKALDACKMYTNSSNDYPPILYQLAKCQLALGKANLAEKTAIAAHLSLDTYHGELPIQSRLKSMLIPEIIKKCRNSNHYQ